MVTTATSRHPSDDELPPGCGGRGALQRGVVQRTALGGLLQAPAGHGENLEKIRASLLRRRPEGNTHLRPAIQLALGYRNGSLDPKEVEVDTIVVLCDGETASGSAWVIPFLDQIRAEVRVVFHCILMATDWRWHLGSPVPGDGWGGCCESPASPGA